MRCPCHWTCPKGQHDFSKSLFRLCLPRGETVNPYTDPGDYTAFWVAKGNTQSVGAQTRLRLRLGKRLLTAPALRPHLSNLM